MKRVQVVDHLIKQTRFRFVLFTVLGAGIVVALSVLSLRYHQRVIAQQAALQDLYRNISRQSALVNQIALLGTTLGKRLDTKTHKEVKAELSEAVRKLGQQNENLRRLLRNGLPDAFNGPRDERVLLHLETRMQGYLHRADQLAERPWGRHNGAHAEYLVSRSHEDIIETLSALAKKAEEEHRQQLRGLKSVGGFLVGLCLLEIILVWALVFRPLYKTIRVQHEKLSEAVMQSQSASRAKTDFLANISHEIRTPMTAILGYAEMLDQEDELTREKKREAVRIINSNASHLLGLVDEILDVAKIEAGRITLAPDRVDLSSLMNEVFALLEVKAAEKGIRLAFHQEGSTPKYVTTDPKRVKQILFNIVGNAVKFTQEGEVLLTASHHRRERGEYLEFIVSDTGPGIASHKLGKLFAPFQQADTSVSRRYGGTGLGLALSRGLALAMGGDISIVSTAPGKGTTFRVVIQASAAEAPEVKAAEAPSMTERALAGAHLLVVDDAAENARLFQLNLASAGAKVDVAQGGDEALNLARARHYHLVLLDLQMPGKDGFQVLRELREHGFSGPVVALTAHAMEEERRKTRLAGFDGHVTKPIPSSQLVATVANFLGSPVV